MQRQRGATQCFREASVADVEGQNADAGPPEADAEGQNADAGPLEADANPFRVT